MSPTIADGPLTGMWVKVSVQSCMAATFESPEGNSWTDTAETTYRTAVIAGRVVESGISYGEQWLDTPERQAKYKKLLPKTGQSIALAMRSYEIGFCRSQVNKSQRFNYDYSCDTSTRRGYCIPNLQLAEPAVEQAEVSGGHNQMGERRQPAHRVE